MVEIYHKSAKLNHDLLFMSFITTTYLAVPFVCTNMLHAQTDMMVLIIILINVTSVSAKVEEKSVSHKLIFHPMHAKIFF